MFSYPRLLLLSLIGTISACAIVVPLIVYCSGLKKRSIFVAIIIFVTLTLVFGYLKNNAEVVWFELVVLFFVLVSTAAVYAFQNWFVAEGGKLDLNTSLKTFSLLCLAGWVFTFICLMLFEFVFN